MPRTDLSQEPPSASLGSAQNAARCATRGIRQFANEYSRAQRAAALADRDHAHPAQIRKLYLDDESAPRIESSDTAVMAASDNDMRRGREVATRVRFAALIVVLGLIALIAHTS